MISSNTVKLKVFRENPDSSSQQIFKEVLAIIPTLGITKTRNHLKVIIMSLQKIYMVIFPKKLKSDLSQNQLIGAMKKLIKVFFFTSLK